ncbi:aspartate--tRNA ligase [Ruminococcus flavefaciens]|uniref:aspartate--tRNA ligase n=1 Tax=Ruminococcus flavefaciens TaxID=1265 RepID=UPI0026EE300D|nr:aspartate--tRNA ligase [Ruminococcus flavefaciens]MDD7515665.1 aspartate--tRNA ligase [Ruminococcus flavefaciens]MDY5690360.1 aspartate--tRNA ligase [Ruminococcus flavefaciens]
MADSMKGLKRTHYCGEVTEAGKEVVVGGFVDRIRDKGGVIFIVLRDRTGVVQLLFNDETDREIFEKAASCKSEYVLMAKGEVRERESKNDKLKTGNVEIFVNDLRVLAKAQTPPFEITNETKVNDELRLKYRYLDLRRAPLQQNIIMRHEIAKVTREYFYENGFLEIETPMMMKSTPEGARDYLIPSRVHQGKFYALPQSPQIYKQLLMISGFDRYIQLARCFRDEDLRADRQPEFTQIDLEMSFVDAEDIQECVEGFIKRVFKEVIGVDVPTPLPRLTFADAMNRYGSDKPDTRFGFEIQDITDTVKDIDFVVFKNAIEEGGSVRTINVKNGAGVYTRKEIDKLVDHAKGIGAKGLAYIRWADEPNCSFKKFLADGDLEKICSAVDAHEGDLVLICADKTRTVLSTLGAIRLICAKKLDVIPEDVYNFVWITEMPFFEFDDEHNTWVAAHHPFTMPMEECLEYLDTDPANVRAKAWDLVLNGTELSSGSMRITDFELQQKMFEALGMSDDEIQAKFGFLVDAYRYGAPPHGGMGIGLDRIAMIMCKADSLRDVTAFPKVQNASELMSECPSYVDDESLDVLGISVVKKEDE